MSPVDAPAARVVLHADDFGMNSAVNAGILRSFREGLLTSTSLLANAPVAIEACQQWTPLIQDQNAQSLPSSEVRRQLADPQLPFDLGIHINLTQGRPLTGAHYPANLLDSVGQFPGIGAAFSRLSRCSSSQLEAVKTELQAQVAWMCDHSLQPTHLNGHQYIELIPPVSAMIPELLQRFSIPVVRVACEAGLLKNVLARGRVTAWGLAIVKRYYANRFRKRMHNARISFPDRFFGTSHAGLVDQRTIEAFLAGSAPRSTEIGLHPGTLSSSVPPPDPWHDPLAQLRPDELNWLCGQPLRDLLSKRSFSLGRLQTLAE